MDIPSCNMMPPADDLVRWIRELGLESHVVDLDVYGFTVVPPQKLAAGDLTERLRDAILRVHERRGGAPVGDYRVDDTTEHPRRWWYLFEDDVFQEAITNPTLLTLARYLCGQSALLTSTVYILKSKTINTQPLHLHNDTVGVPLPRPQYAQWCNLSWILTDYDGPDDGPTVVVPGSHKWGRDPTPYEAEFWQRGAPVKPVPLRAVAGSLAVWHGNLWHGSIPRKKDGLRITLPFTFGRQHMRPVHLWRGRVPDEAVRRRPELRKILGLDHPFPFEEEMEGSLESALACAQNQFA